MLHRSGLDKVAVDGDRVTIGAMVPVAALTDSDDTVLADVARHIADAEVRRNATVGGNLCAPPGTDAQRGDLGAALIALGAQVRSAGAGGERTEPVEDFLAGDRNGRLVLDVSYDRREQRSATASLRRRHAHSYAIATVAACARRPSDLRIGVTGVGPTAIRCRSVETSGDAERRPEGRRAGRRRGRLGGLPAQRAAQARPRSPRPTGALMKLIVNGVEQEIVSAPLTPLLHVLRDELDITSPKAGCQQGGCGTCTVLSTASRAGRA